MATADVLVPSYMRVTPGSVNIPVATFPKIRSDPSDPKSIAIDWAKSFNGALAKGDPKNIASFFLEDSYWRDHLALSWDYHTATGSKAVESYLSELKNGVQLQNVEIDLSTPFRSPHIAAFDLGDVKGVESFLTFKTKLGSGNGLVRLAEEQGKWKIFNLFTTLTELVGYEESTGLRRPQGVEHGGQKDRKNWLDRRAADENYDSTEPTVLIVGMSL